MVTYDVQKMKKDLKQLDKDLEGHEKAAIAASEKVSYETVKAYLQAEKFPTLALAAAIIKSGKRIILERTQTA